MSLAERRLVEAAGARLEVFIAGGPSGAPAIAAAHPAEAYDGATAALLASAGGARVACINPRGLGGSDPPAPGRRPTLADMVDDLEAVRRRLAWPPWAFWGLSGGGWLAQLYARRHPAALTAIVVESCGPCFRERLADPRCLASPFHPAWRAALAAAGLLDERAHDEPGAPGDTEWDEVPGVGPVFRRRSGPALLVSPVALSPALRAAMPVLWDFDARPWLASLRIPTLVVCGAADPIVPVAHARAVHALVPGATLVVVEGAGHVPVSERRPEVGAAVQRLLARAQDGGASAGAGPDR